VKKFLTPSRLIAAGFAVVILLGTLALLFPQASARQPLSFTDALFTATSATCVTGLIVVDTGSYFSTFGQIVILVLIQLGGLGIMTFSTLFLFLLRGRFSGGTRDLLSTSFAPGQFISMRKLIRTIFAFTFFSEALGTVLLSWRFMQTMPTLEAVWHAVFHAISAFCNAGFALYSDSFMGYSADWFVNAVLMLLIISGGLGFVVVFEVLNFTRRKQAKISFHSKLVLRMTGFLLAGGWILFLVFEWNNALAGLTPDERVLAAFFQSVTARTAGFNTVDFSLLAPQTLLFVIFLMFVGASPGSCGGGVKTTTFAVLLGMLRSRAQNQNDVTLYFRRIPEATVSRAISVAFFFIILAGAGTLLLSISETTALTPAGERAMVPEYLFECVSALGTVGLSTGVTATLSHAGKLLITLLMFVGRLGPLTISMALLVREKKTFRYPSENIMIG